MDDESENLLGKVRFVAQGGKFKLSNQTRSFPNFEPHKQRRKIFLNQFRHVVLTVLFLVAYVTTIFSYQTKQPVDYRAKRIFDVVPTILILGLGLNLFEAFKDLAKIARWRILSVRFFELQEVILILRADSWTKVFQLMIRSSFKSRIFLFALIWLLVNLGAQILVAVLPFFASLKRGYDSSGITVSPGHVTVPKLDCFYRSRNETYCDQGITRSRLDPAIAHAYGERRMPYDQRCRYQSTDDIHKASQTCLYLTRDDGREFAVRYADSNPDDINNAYPYYGAQRIITTSAKECNGNLTTFYGTEDNSDGPKNAFVFLFENSTGTYPLSIPRSILALQSTTYVWNSTDPPPLTMSQACGPRCVVLYAVRDMLRGQNHEMSIFQCRIMISNMSNIENPAHVLSDSMARTAAASIALSGRWRKDWDWRQFQLYQDGAVWAAKLNDSPEDVGARMAEYAASTLATMAQQNPIMTVPGSVPSLGYQTDVEWKNTIALTASIAGIHLLMALLALWLARSIVVVDDSYLMRVLLLKGLTRDWEGGAMRTTFEEDSAAK